MLFHRIQQALDRGEKLQNIKTLDYGILEIRQKGREREGGENGRRRRGRRRRRRRRITKLLESEMKEGKYS
jgi:hypothetical protein